ncbi:hypothetical protein diail_1185 [Diaporthe ilicicola]|nr:hypothetical protein diail_1185 [Diaporthe ilicicola]
MATNGNTDHQEQWRESGGAPSDAPSTSNAADSTPSKDEVGWYFVQQYYTTLSKNPDKLHLFYNKRSQFVQGLEAELSPVAVGRQAISERIKELDFHDCKVRVSNVDSQASYDNIVIQVIGEICNKSGEPKKFVQTFVLAQQPAGYFLLNDILRYVNEGEEEATEGAVSESAPAVEMEAPQEPAAVAAAAAPEPEKAEAEEPAEASPAALDAEVVDEKLEEASSTAKDTPSTTAAETPVEAAPAVEEAPSKPQEAETSADPEKAAQEIAEEEAKKPELPKDPSPTPAPSRAPPAPEPEKPKGPPKPMSWASRAAAAVGVPVKPVVPLPKAAPAAAAPAQQRSAAPAPAQSKPSAAPAQPSESAAQPADKDAASEWRTAGADSKRQSRQQSTSTPPAEKEGTLAYVKFVTEKVKEDDLRAALGSYGEMVYFDINRSKNCAFVEYSAAGGYQAAIGASPITVNGENIVVEPRRPKAGAYGGANYNQNRGSISGRGRGFEGQRSGSQGGGRGGYPSRGRGGAPRGRGGPQATNA